MLLYQNITTTELVNFQDLKISSRQNSEVQPSVTKHKKLKMHLNDIINYNITNISHQFHVNNVNMLFYATKHETLLVMSINDSFCA